VNNINPSKNHITFDRGNKASFVLKRINTGHFLTKPIKEWIPFDQRGRPIKMAVKAFSTAHYYNCPEPPSEVKRVCDIEISQVQGRNVFTLRPKGVKGARHIFYLHGIHTLQTVDQSLGSC